MAKVVEEKVWETLFWLPQSTVGKLKSEIGKEKHTDPDSYHWYCTGEPIEYLKREVFLKREICPNMGG